MTDRPDHVTAPLPGPGPIITEATSGPTATPITRPPMTLSFETSGVARTGEPVGEPPTEEVRRNTLPIGFSPANPSPAGEAATTSIPSIAALIRDRAVEFPVEGGVVLHPSGVALVRTREATPELPDRSFAVRLASVRASSGAVSYSSIDRQVRGRATGEALGGLASPLVRASGTAELVVGPRRSFSLLAFAIDGDGAFFREDVLLGFELSLLFENGKLSLSEGEPSPIVQFKGAGVVVLEVAVLGGAGGVGALAVTSKKSLTVRREVVIGWSGRILPRPVPVAEAPLGQRGLVHFAGDGALLVSLA